MGIAVAVLITMGLLIRKINLPRLLEYMKC